jgi:hypothetical protein
VQDGEEHQRHRLIQLQHVPDYLMSEDRLRLAQVGEAVRPSGPEASSARACARTIGSLST